MVFVSLLSLKRTSDSYAVKANGARPTELVLVNDCRSSLNLVRGVQATSSCGSAAKLCGPEGKGASDGGAGANSSGDRALQPLPGLTFILYPHPGLKCGGNAAGPLRACPTGGS